MNRKTTLTMILLLIRILFASSAPNVAAEEPDASNFAAGLETAFSKVSEAINNGLETAAEVVAQVANMIQNAWARMVEWVKQIQKDIGGGV